MADEIEDTFDKLKAGAKAVAKEVTEPSSIPLIELSRMLSCIF